MDSDVVLYAVLDLWTKDSFSTSIDVGLVDQLFSHSFAVLNAVGPIKVFPSQGRYEVRSDQDWALVDRDGWHSFVLWKCQSLMHSHTAVLRLTRLTSSLELLPSTRTLRSHSLAQASLLILKM